LQHSHNRPNNRPGLQWTELAIFTSDTEVKGRGRPSCQVSVAEAGFDHKTKTEKLKFSYSFGWEQDGKFMPLRHLPDENITEFLAEGARASSEAKVSYLNALKKQKGALAASIKDALTQAR
jgi:hypothetical protein